VPQGDEQRRARTERGSDVSIFKKCVCELADVFGGFERN
jgi:hypothetical protein